MTLCKINLKEKYKIVHLMSLNMEGDAKGKKERERRMTKESAGPKAK